MSKTVLYYKIPGCPSEKLYCGSLTRIDELTANYQNEYELRRCVDFGYRIDSYISRYSPNNTNSNPGRFILCYIEDNDKSEIIRMRFDDKKPIITRYNSFNNNNNEIENARKLLFSSKNNSFLRSAMEKDWFHDTTGCYIRLKPIEARELIKSGFNLVQNNSDYCATIEQIFEYRLKKKKLGFMKELFEDVLEIWKNKVEELPDDTLYYYSRNLRISIKDYHNSMKRLRPICHFESNDKKMAQILRFRDSAVDIKNKYGGKTIHFDKNYKVKKMSA